MAFNMELQRVVIFLLINRKLFINILRYENSLSEYIFE